MVIIEMTTYESDFVEKSTARSGAHKIRTFDINHESSLFAFYYEEYIHLKLRRYHDEETTHNDWNQLKAAGILQPDICLNDASEIFLDMEDNQMHVHIPYPIYKRSDSSWKDQ